jgi:hypothetical protein
LNAKSRFGGFVAKYMGDGVLVREVISAYQKCVAKTVRRQIFRVHTCG